MEVAGLSLLLEEDPSMVLLVSLGLELLPAALPLGGMVEVVVVAVVQVVVIGTLLPSVHPHCPLHNPHLVSRSPP